MLGGEFNIGTVDDHRIPDDGLMREYRDTAWNDTAALVVEIISPGDESLAKLGFYAAHGIDEIVLVDPGEQTVAWLALTDQGDYRPTERSRLLQSGATELSALIDWPPVQGA